jgi:isopentenyldiphosphate isomerase
MNNFNQQKRALLQKKATSNNLFPLFYDNLNLCAHLLGALARLQEKESE